MKKLIIGLAAGAMALGASVVPASAGVVGDYTTDGGWEMPWTDFDGSIWDYINDSESEFPGEDTYAEQLVLIAGMANTLDACGNGKPLYTLFLPTDSIWTLVLGEDGLDTTIAELAGTPAVVKGILSDHLVSGAVDPYMMTQAGVKKLVAISGYVINIRELNTIYDSYSLGPVPAFGVNVWEDFYANGQQIIDATATCNGWIYEIFGFFDPRDFVETLGQNHVDNASGSAASSLPDTL